MVQLTATFIGVAALAAQLVSAAPRPNPQDDSAIGQEVAVSAPNGIPITDTAELISQSLREAAARTSALGGMGAAAYSPPAVAYPAATTTFAPEVMLTTSSFMAEQTSVMMEHPSMMVDHSMMQPSSSAAIYQAPPAVTQPPSLTTTAYGSGSTTWNNVGYDNCVQQCVAQFGSPPGNAPSPVGGGAVGGNGVTHTVIVAPTQGVLRYVPFAVNASVGDTVKFMWNANVHTVTQSSQLALCNATSGAFASGRQNQSFVFSQVVNTTEPTFFHCAVPTHCQKGMFGIINPPTGLVSETSIANVMPSLIANSTDMAAMAMYANRMTSGNLAASMWGGSFDTAGMPEWAVPLMAENVMYSRTFLAANPETLMEDGSVDLSSASDMPLMVPEDLSVALSATAPSDSTTSSSGTAAASTPAASSDSDTAGQLSGARGLGASMGVTALVALVATVLAL